MKKEIILGIIAVIIAGFVVFVSLKDTPRSDASAPAGYATGFSTSSIATLVQDIPLTLFATSTDCTSRVITTIGFPITIKFGDHARWTLTSNTGHRQLASTTVEYDSGIYGCGLWTATGLIGTATTGVNVVATEFSGFR